MSTNIRRNRYHLSERIAALPIWEQLLHTEPNLLARMIETQRRMRVQQTPPEQQAERFDKLMYETAKKTGHSLAPLAPTPVTSMPIVHATTSSVAMKLTHAQAAMVLPQLKVGSLIEII